MECLRKSIEEVIYLFPYAFFWIWQVCNMLTFFSYKVMCGVKFIKSRQINHSPEILTLHHLQPVFFSNTYEVGTLHQSYVDQ